ncbi:MAG TPA: hypothetical protein VGC84_13595 [Ilumatobacteraceae bacterium]
MSLKCVFSGLAHDAFIPTNAHEGAAMKIIPVQPKQAPAAENQPSPAATTAGVVASRRTFGAKFPSRRTFGSRFPSRRTFGSRVP